MGKVNFDHKELEEYFDKLDVGECIDISMKGSFDDEDYFFSGSICRIDEKTIKGTFSGPDDTKFEVEIRRRKRYG